MLLASAVAAALLFVVMITLGRDLPRMGLLRGGFIALFAMALIMAGVVCIRGMRQALRWLRGS
jgi:hypothetical protein